MLEALLLAPTNAVAVARYARKLADQNPAQNPRARGEADFLSRRALTLSPNNAEVLKLRAEVERKIAGEKKPWPANGASNLAKRVECSGLSRSFS